MNKPADSADYLRRKREFDRLLTIYGRKPVLEALQDNTIPIARLHLADSNKPGGIVSDIVALANRRNVDIKYHSREALSRISRNAKQDQGVAADLACENYHALDDFLAGANTPFRVIALDGITNPQNLGMIIRSVCASTVSAILLPRKGCAEISPLVIKASAGTLFKSPIVRCDDLATALQTIAKTGADIAMLSSHDSIALDDYKPTGSVVYVLGNETNGVSPATAKQCNLRLGIPMQRGVESLNVAVTAALLAFKGSI